MRRALALRALTPLQLRLGGEAAKPSYPLPIEGRGRGVLFTPSSAGRPLRVCFLTEGAARRGLSPAARFRVLEYLPHLRAAGVEPVVRPSRPSKYFAHGRAMGRVAERLGPRAATVVARLGYRLQVANRWRDFRVARGCDVVVLQRDLQTEPEPETAALAEDIRRGVSTAPHRAKLSSTPAIRTVVTRADIAAEPDGRKRKRWRRIVVTVTAILLAALVILTSTPGLGELIEGVVHAAIESGDELDHHEVDSCKDSCATGGCTQGFFHTCRCNAAPVAPTTAPDALARPGESVAARAPVTNRGGDRPAHRTPPFRPPSI